MSWGNAQMSPGERGPLEIFGVRIWWEADQLQSRACKWLAGSGAALGWMLADLGEDLRLVNGWRPQGSWLGCRLENWHECKLKCNRLVELLEVATQLSQLFNFTSRKLQTTNVIGFYKTFWGGTVKCKLWWISKQFLLNKENHRYNSVNVLHNK